MDMNGLILIGKILNARENKLRMSSFYKENYANAEARLKGARSSYNHFGMYEDCGSSYEDDYTEAKVIHKESQKMLPMVINSEKYYKKLKHQLQQQYPDLMPVLEQQLEQQTKELDEKYRSTNKKPEPISKKTIKPM